MTDKTVATQIAVIGPKGQRASVIAVPDPSSSVEENIEPPLVYGMGGLIVAKISEFEFRDFQGVIWTVDVAATRS